MDLLLLILVCGMRFWNLGKEGLWADEAYTAVISRHSLGSLRAALREDDAPALFYLCEKAFVAILGDAEWAVRLFPALCGSAAIVASWALLRRYAPRAALAGILVTGFSSLAMFYTQQARSYSLLHLLSVLVVWALLRLRDHSTLERALALSALLLVLLHTHNLALWTVGAVAILGLLRLRARPRLALIFAGSLAFGAIPWGLAVLQQLGRHRGANQWISSWWDTHPLVLAPFFSALVFLNGGATTVRPPVPMPILAEAEHGFLSIAPHLLVIVIALLAAFALIRLAVSAAVKHSGASQQTNNDASTIADSFGLGMALVVCALAPLAGLWITHVVVGPSYVVARTDTLALFPFLLLLTLGWARAGAAIRTSALALWIVAFLLPLLPQTGRSVPKGSDRALASWIAPRVEAGDAIVVPPVGRPTLEYYGGRQGWLGKLQSLSTFPPIGDLNPAAAFPTPLDSLDAYREQALALRESWERSGVGTVWCEGILLARNPGQPQYPTAPPPDRAHADANQLSFPTSLLVYTLVGLTPAEVSAEYRRDWMGGDRVLLAIPRSSWIPVDSLTQEVEIR